MHFTPLSKREKEVGGTRYANDRKEVWEARVKAKIAQCQQVEDKKYRDDDGATS
uniref:Uncharacterized protein n=1 Tax=Candidatus Kentrum sp. FW TaxID=2126338 RepID=A0A450SCS5_9GAMM|nr:MAG: hypothetical protein BECKFW1821B_GA0114236_100648 [Candidatus Kentron sp. FW]